jgi:hypothetical protein
MSMAAWVSFQAAPNQLLQLTLIRVAGPARVSFQAALNQLLQLTLIKLAEPMMTQVLHVDALLLQ